MTSKLKQKIPSPIISFLASKMSIDEITHSELNNLFLYVDVRCDINLRSNKTAKIISNFDDINTYHGNPLQSLGKILQKVLKVFEQLNEKMSDSVYRKFYEDLLNELNQCGLNYSSGNITLIGEDVPVKSLEDYIKDKDLLGLQEEINRATDSISTRPKEAVSAAYNILETVCKTFIEDNQLAMPTKKDLRSIIKVVLKKLDTSNNEHLQQVVNGLKECINGICYFRTHHGAAHGDHGSSLKDTDPRDARLVVNASATISLFILERFDDSKNYIENLSK